MNAPNPPPAALPAPASVVDFWRAAGPKAWFRKDPAFDAALRTRFETAHDAAARGELSAWEASAEGALALILLLDQIPRNLWRGSARAFETDAVAREVSRRAIAAGRDRAVEPGLRVFVYLPFSHSETLADQELGLALTEALERDGGPSAASARGHRAIVARFGRFPHRNAVLGRDTTAEEQAFLNAGGFAG